MKLFAHLKTARADGSFTVETKLIAKQNLVIFDDFGLKQLDSDSRLFLVELIENRSGVKSTTISSVVPVLKWFDVIGDTTVADAICDRVVHIAHKMQLMGQYMRKQQKKFCTKPATLWFAKNARESALNVAGISRNGWQVTPECLKKLFRIHHFGRCCNVEWGFYGNAILLYTQREHHVK